MVFISTKERSILILICGGKESTDSCKFLSANLQKLPFQNIELRFLSRDVYKEAEDTFLDESLFQYTKTIDSQQETILVMLTGNAGEGLVGTGKLFDKGALCLI
ncbi:hypothetical protein OAK75_11415, partial [Bacteriovoracales bacterium]|nr:hypothetical protein [Bacteriovoracales bacterium]